MEKSPLLISLQKNHRLSHTSLQKEAEIVIEPIGNTEAAISPESSATIHKPLSVAYIPLPSFVIEGDIPRIANRVNSEKLDIVAFSGDPRVLEKLKNSLQFSY